MNILDAIGHTPLVELRRLRPPGAARLLVKLEYANPTGSMKDRMALAAINAAEADGRLLPGGTVVEYTGGTTGVSLAFVCAKAMARRLAGEEGIFAGTSSGANLVAAVRIAQRLGPAATVATIMVDSGLRYVSTDVFGRPPT